MDRFLSGGAPVIVRALISLIPVGGGPLEVLVGEGIQVLANRRKRVFFDELSKGMHGLSEVLIDSEDFLHCYFATFRTAMRSRRDKKIRFLARLISGAARSNGAQETDDYEELLSIVDELSFRELELLIGLSNAPNPGPYRECDMSSNLRDYGIEPEESASFLYRLLRSGLIGVTYEPASDGFWDKRVEGKWYFTSRLTRLKQIVAAGYPRSPDEHVSEKTNKA